MAPPPGEAPRAAPLDPIEVLGLFREREARAPACFQHREIRLARGYRNMPDLTAERFIANPFSAEPDSKLFRSGDFGRFLADGQIVFLGRADDQIKIRGHRIEPNEIVGALNRHPKIRESLVVRGRHTAGDVKLFAYLEMDEDAGITEIGLRDFLREQLPEVMVPEVFVRLNALHEPDRKRLICAFAESVGIGSTSCVSIAHARSGRGTPPLRKPHPAHRPTGSRRYGTGG